MYFAISAPLLLIVKFTCQQLLQLELLHPPQPEEAVPPPVELFPVRKDDITLGDSFPQAGHLTLSTEPLQSSSNFLLQSEQKNS
jgi:hypothetical protein